MPVNVSLVRSAVHIVGSIGLSKVFNDIIKNNTTIETTADAVKVWVGSIVLGSMITEQASKHVNGRLDSIIAWNEKRKEVPAVS